MHAPLSFHRKLPIKRRWEMAQGNQWRFSVPSLMWLQTGSCGGDSLALLSAESPSFEQLISLHGIELLWHPSFSSAPTSHLAQLITDIEADRRSLDILCIEGSIVTGPQGTGLFDSWHGRAKSHLVRALAEKAGAVVAVGTCAAFGGVHAAPPTLLIASACNSTTRRRAACCPSNGARAWACQ